MTEKPNQYQETTEEGSNKKPGFELPQAHAEKIAKELSGLADLISHDQPVKEDDVDHLDSAVHAIKVGEIENIPNLEKSLEIWEEVKKGKFDRLAYLTFITDEMVEQLNKMDYYPHNFASVTNISDRAIKSLVGRGELCLGISSISDQAAEYLGKQQGRLTLWKLTEISDIVAEEISKIPDSLYLNALTTISDSAAERLGKHVGELILDGITEISDKAIEYLSRNQGELRFCALRTLTDQAAESLGKRDPKNRVCLKGLTTISDRAAKFLSHNEGVEFNGSYGIWNIKVQAQILKYRK